MPLHLQQSRFHQHFGLCSACTVPTAPAALPVPSATPLPPPIEGGVELCGQSRFVWSMRMAAKCRRRPWKGTSFKSNFRSEEIREYSYSIHNSNKVFSEIGECFTDFVEISAVFFSITFFPVYWPDLHIPLFIELHYIIGHPSFVVRICGRLVSD